MHPLRILIAAAALAAATPGLAQAQDSFVRLSGIIAVEQSHTPGVHEDGVALVRTDGTFIGPDNSWGLGGHAAFSPDGRLLATSFEGCVWFTPILERYWPGFAGSGCTFGTEPRASDPAFSSDGRRIAFIGESTVAGQRRWDVYVKKIDEPGLRRLTDDGAYKADPQWRADGRIAFVLDPGDGSPSDIHSVRSDAQAPDRPVRETTGTDAKYISFPDDQVGAGAAAYIASGNTSSVPDRLIVQGVEVLRRPTWSLRGVAWAPGLTPAHLVVAVSQGSESELLIITRGGGVERRLPVGYPSNPAWTVDAFAGGAGTGGAPPATDRAADPQAPPRSAPREERPPVPDGLAATGGRAHAGRVALELGCPDPVDCRIAVAGRATAAPAGRAAAAAGRRSVRLAAKRYRVAAGSTRRVRYRLPRAARRLLRARRPLRLRLDVTVTGARTRTQVRRITLRPPPSRPHRRRAR